jgi:hypothetical protein
MQKPQYRQRKINKAATCQPILAMEATGETGNAVELQ